MHLELSYDPLKALISARTHVSSQNWGNSHSPELSWTVSLWIWLHVIGQPVSWGHKVRGNSEPGTIFAGKVVVLFSCSVVSDSLQPHELQHARVPCPSLSSRVCSNSCPLSWWCHPTISSSVTLFSCPQSFPTSRSCPVSQLFASGGQSIGSSASASILPMSTPGWFPLGLTGLISLPSILRCSSQGWGSLVGCRLWDRTESDTTKVT